MRHANDNSTKNALLKAAVQVFADRGFQAATVRDICKAADANVAAVNYHFGGKEALYSAVLERIFAHVESYDLPAEYQLRADATPEEKLHNFVRVLVYEIYELGEQGEGVAQMGAIFMMEMSRPSENLDFLVQRYVQPKVRELRGIIRDILGEDAPDPMIVACSFSLWSQVMNYLFIGPIMKRLPDSFGNFQDDLNAVTDHITMFTLRGLEGMRQRLG